MARKKKRREVLTFAIEAGLKARRTRKLFVRLTEHEEQVLMKAADGFSGRCGLTLGLATWARMALLKAAAE